MAIFHPLQAFDPHRQFFAALQNIAESCSSLREVDAAVEEIEKRLRSQDAREALQMLGGKTCGGYIRSIKMLIKQRARLALLESLSSRVEKDMVRVTNLSHAELEIFGVQTTFGKLLERFSHEIDSGRKATNKLPADSLVEKFSESEITDAQQKYKNVLSKVGKIVLRPAENLA